MLSKLLPLIPDHVCYCEPFAGGLALLLAKPRSAVEVVNDLNGDLVALYRNLQYHLPEILRELQFFFAARKTFNDFTAQPGLMEIQRAARFLLRNRISFGGGMKSWAVSRTRGGGAAFSREGATAMLGKAHERLDKVVVENLSYERCMELYDSKDTFFFIDPPYLNAVPVAYQGWSEEQMRRFAKLLRRVKGKWVVTLDDSALNRELFADCSLTSVETQNGCAKASAQSRFKELIIQPK